MRVHIQSVTFRFEWPAYIIRWPELKWKATECRPQLEHRWPSWSWDNSMVLMESYFFCASVRLGVLVTCIAAIVSLVLYQMVANTSSSHFQIKNTIFMWLIFANGTTFLYFFINILETYYKTSTIVKESVTWAEHCKHL